MGRGGERPRLTWSAGGRCLVLILVIGGCRSPETKTREAPVASAGQVPAQTLSADTIPPMPAGIAPPVSPVGKYLVRLPAVDAAGQRISLDLRPDSTCVLKTERLGKGEHIEGGTWAPAAGLVRIVIGPPRDPSKQKKFAFVARGDSLVCTEWDSVLFGTEGLGTLVRQ